LASFNEWVDGSGNQQPSDWEPEIPAVPAGEWAGSCGCAPPGQAVIADTINLVGSPGQITSIKDGVALWSLVLSDGTPANDMRLDRFDDTGTLVDSPITAERATGIVTFHDPVMLSADPTQPLGAATKEYVDNTAVHEAPSGLIYSRQNAAWVADPIQADAPNDGQFYTRKSAAWAVSPGGMIDAPNDGTAYARNSAAWVHLAHTDITDWTATLAPYALTSAVPVASTTLPLINSTAAVGTGTTWARADHIHPVDTSRYAASNPSGYQTAAQVTAALPIASSTPPLMDSIAAIGTGTTWARADHVHSSDTSRLALSGGTMTGDIVLAHDPPAALNPATKQYVDATNIRYRNRIINGDMTADQRNGGSLVAMPTGNAYLIDRWKLNNPSAVASKGSCGQLMLASPPPGFPVYGLQFATSTAYPTPAASDAIRFLTIIEGYNFLDAQWGTAQAQPIVVEFWANAPVAGTYAFSVNNYAATRSYVATYTLPANTWTKVRVNIPGDTGGTWAVAANAGMLVLGISLCVGATAQTSTLNAWQPGNFISAAGVVNVLSAVNNSLSITGVALMVGAAAANAEPEFRKYSENLIDCQRYYEKCNAQWIGDATISGTYGCYVSYAVEKRATPVLTSITQSGAANGNINVRALAISPINPTRGVFWGGTAAATGAGRGFNDSFAADSDF
jgi:hypothetical protein